VPRLLSRVIALTTLAVMLLVPLSGTAAAAFGWNPIDCCCGEHAGDEACGCPDCPAGHQDDDDDDGDDGDEHDEDGAPGMRSCGVSGHVSLPGVFVRAVLPELPALIAPPARVVHPDDPALPRPSPAPRPEKPPS